MTHNPEWKENTELWDYLQIGGLSNFIERIQGFDQDISIKFTQGWKNRIVKYSNMKMEIMEDLIAHITGLSLEGTKFFNKK
ncbi:hypothetical protein KI387_026563, partial [Taxus chinensis]